MKFEQMLWFISREFDLKFAFLNGLIGVLGVKKIIRYIREVRSPRLIQFSPPRTGSTLLWNVLRTVCPKHEVMKVHCYDTRRKSDFMSPKVVASIRNPLDSIASSIQRYEQQPTVEVVDEQIQEFDRNGMWDLLNLKGNSRALILRYEDFFDDWPYLFSQIEAFMGFRIDEGTKNDCIQSFSMETVERQAKLLGAFSSYDQETHIHGKHISEFRGQVGYGYNFRFFVNSCEESGVEV